MHFGSNKLKVGTLFITVKDFVSQMQDACTIPTTEKKVNITQIYAFSYQISSALLKSVNIALLLFPIAIILPISPASSQSIVTNLYMIPIFSPMLMISLMLHFHLRQSLDVKQQ